MAFECRPLMVGRHGRRTKTWKQMFDKCLFLTNFMEHIIKYIAGKLRIIILRQFELITFRFAYVRDRNA